MRHFSLEEYQKNPERPIVTRRGNPVRIICTDRKHGDDDLPIVFLEDCKIGEFLMACKSNGKSDDGDSIYDLFFDDTMTQDERQELLAAIAGYLPYGLKIETPRGAYDVDAVCSEGLFSITDDGTLNDMERHDGHCWLPIQDCYKPFLRSLSTMTDSEKDELAKLTNGHIICDNYNSIAVTLNRFDKYWQTSEIEWAKVFTWLNKNHFDYHYVEHRSLITRGLANEAPEGMYN